MAGGVLEGKVAVITGSTRGFGLAMANAFAQAGSAVVVSSRSGLAAGQAADGLKAAGSRAVGMACDVTDLAQVQALCAAALKEFGRLDVWVNNAGISAPYGPTIHQDPAAFTAVTQTNILGAYHGSLVAMRHFLPRRQGKLINILGRGERGPAPMQSAYGASKAWLRSFTQALAEEYKDSGVGVFAFSPGMMDTDLITDVEVVAGFEQKLSSLESVVQALSQPPEIPARRAVWIASSATDGKTGQVVRELSGGKVMVRFAKQGLGRLFRRPGRPVQVQVRSVPAHLPEQQED